MRSSLKTTRGGSKNGSLNPDNDDYPLDVAGEEEVTTQDKEKDKEDMEDDEEDEEDEEDDEEEDEELEEMIKVSIVQAGEEGDVRSSG